MLLSLLNVLLDSPARFLQLAPIWFIIISGGVLTALTVHEFSHALVAYMLGDTTAKRQGRISLNPLRHLDAAGTWMFLIVGFGWGKPVQFNPDEVRGGTQGIGLIAAAGPVSNFTAAALLALIARAGHFSLDPRIEDSQGYPIGDPLGATLQTILVNPGSLELWISGLASAAFFLNILLGIFNLLPIAPLDGFQVALGILPQRMALALRQFSQYGMLLLFGIIGADFIFGWGILFGIIDPVRNTVSSFLIGT